MYILVFNISKLHEAFLEFYLAQIMNTASTDIKPPILLVGTHADALGKLVAQNVCQKMRQQFKNRGYRIVGCIPFCGISGTGLQEVQETLVGAVSANQFLRLTIPRSWLDLHNKIRLLQETTQLISWSKFCEYAGECKVEEKPVIVAKFLHDVGLILFYENISEKFGNFQSLQIFTSLTEMVIIDPQYLSSVFTTVVSVQQTSFITRGILMREVIPFIWKKYLPAEHPLLLSLLEKFDIMFPLCDFTVPTGTPPDKFLVPCFLPANEPASLATMWPFSPQQSETQYSRSYHFSSMPIGLFGHILVRVMRLPVITNSLYWKNNVVVSARITTLIEQYYQYAKLEFTSLASSSYQLHIHVRAPKYKVPSILAEIVSLVDTCLQSFYRPIMRTISTFVSCTHCTLPKKPGDPSPYDFPLKDCVAALNAGKRVIFCPICTTVVVLDAIAPDLSISNLNVIDPSVVSKDTILGQGGYGKVWRGTWQDQEVAIKEILKQVASF